MTVALLLILTPVMLGSMHGLHYQTQILAAMDRQQHLQSRVRSHLAQAVAAARVLPANAAATGLNWQVIPLAAVESTAVATYYQLRATADDAGNRVIAEALYRSGIQPAVRMLRFVQ